MTDEEQHREGGPADGSVSFDAAYAESPPWDIGHPQPAFVDLARSGSLAGHVLDVGCGTGEHALMAAAQGLEATGIDLAPTAIRLAEEKAQDRGLGARFLVADALDLASLTERFQTVLDCGLFHVFDDQDRIRFVESLGSVLAPGGRYFMLCFSDRQPGDWGPRRVSLSEIHAAFADGWRVESIDPTRLEITIDPEGAHAWLAVISRI